MRSQHLVVVVAAVVAGGPVLQARAAGVPALAHAASAATLDAQATPEPPAPPKPPRPPVPPKARDWESRDEQADRVSRTFKVGETTTLDISNMAGNINISAGPAGEIRVDAVKRAHGPEAQQQLENTRISMEERSGRVEVRAFHGGSKGRVSVDFTVVVPASAMVFARSMSGDLAISGVKGALEAETVSGDVTATGLGRVSSLRSVSGDVTLKGAATDGDLTLSTVSGTLTVEAFKARSLDAGSVSGDVWLHGGPCERALVRSVSGDIDFAVAIAKAGHYELKSHSGGVKITTDGKVGFDVEANTFSGDINSDLPLTARSRDQGGEGRGAGEGHGEGRGPRRRTLNGVYGDGSAHFSLSSFSGDIVIVKK